MSEKIKNIIFLGTPVLIYLASSFFVNRSYYEFSMKRFELCLERSNASNLGVNDCSYISSAADSAFSWATSLYSPVIILLFMVLISLGLKVFKLEKEVKELKEK